MKSVYDWTCSKQESFREMYMGNPELIWEMSVYSIPVLFDAETPSPRERKRLFQKGL